MPRLPLRLALLALTFALALPAAAQDRRAVDVQAALAPHLGAKAARLQADLARYEGEPGYLWRLTEAVQRAATPEERQAVLDAAPVARTHGRTPDRARGERRGTRRGMRPGARHAARGPHAREIGQSLTPEQREQVKALRARHAERLRALRDDALASEDVRAERQALREALRADLHAVLTPEQRAKAEAARAERQAHHEQAAAVRDQVLGLSAAQRERLEEVLEVKGPDRHAVQGAMSEVLTPEQQATAELHHALARLVGRHYADAHKQRERKNRRHEDNR